MSTAARLRVLMWRWSTPFDEASPAEAQACEYAEVMGRDALERQWQGPARARKRVEKLFAKGRRA